MESHQVVSNQVIRDSVGVYYSPYHLPHQCEREYVEAHPMENGVHIKYFVYRRGQVYACDGSRLFLCPEKTAARVMQYYAGIYQASTSPTRTRVLTLISGGRGTPPLR